MKKMVSEDVHDFLNPEEVDPELSAIEAIEDDEFSEDENGEESIEIEKPVDKMRNIFRTEIATPEYSRPTFFLKLKDGRTFEGTPMAELSATEAFLFKIEGQLKKIKLADIQNFNLIEEPEEAVNEGYGEYRFSDYTADISNFIEATIPDWKFLIGEEDRELIDWLEENQDLWDLQSLFAAGVPSEDAAQNIIEELQEGENEEENNLSNDSI
jgi:hypothetical protein